MRFGPRTTAALLTIAASSRATSAQTILPAEADPAHAYLVEGRVLRADGLPAVRRPGCPGVTRTLTLRRGPVPPHDFEGDLLTGVVIRLPPCALDAADAGR